MIAKIVWVIATNIIARLCTDAILAAWKNL